MYWSSDVKDADRAQTESLARSGRASRDNSDHRNIFQRARKHFGVGMVLSKRITVFLQSVQPISLRNILGKLNMQAGTLIVVSSYAPQACRTDPTSSEQHYDEIRSLLSNDYDYS